MRLAAAHFAIAVAAAKRIEKFFFVAVVRKAHAIVQLIEATEACGLDFRKLCVGGVFFENIVEHLGVIERFRDGDAKLFFAAAVCTDMEENEQIFALRAQIRRYSPPWLSPSSLFCFLNFTYEM